MTTTIRTSSKNYFNKIQKYLNNKRVFFTPSINRSALPLGSSKNEVYTLTIFDLSSSLTTSLIQKLTKHFHLSHYQQEPLVDSVEFRHDSAIQAISCVPLVASGKAERTALTAPSLLAA